MVTDPSSLTGVPEQFTNHKNGASPPPLPDGIDRNVIHSSPGYQNVPTKVPEVKPPSRRSGSRHQGPSSKLRAEHSAVPSVRKPIECGAPNKGPTTVVLHKAGGADIKFTSGQGTIVEPQGDGLTPVANIRQANLGDQFKIWWAGEVCKMTTPKF